MLVNEGGWRSNSAVDTSQHQPSEECARYIPVACSNRPTYDYRFDLFPTVRKQTTHFQIRDVI